MDKFFNYLTVPINPEDVDKWLKANNILPEKLELFLDFCLSLSILVMETYLGDNSSKSETNITMTQQDNESHFYWCWVKNIDGFRKENIMFKELGEHKEYFENFFQEIFYSQKDLLVRNSMVSYFEDLFDTNKSFTKFDLEMIVSIYKSLDFALKS